MARFIIKVTDAGTDYYIEWSSITDAPVTYGMTLEEFRQYYESEYGKGGAPSLDDRLKRVQEKGTSARGHVSLEQTIHGNRAGDGERELTLEQIVERFVRDRPRDE